MRFMAKFIAGVVLLAGIACSNGGTPTFDVGAGPGSIRVGLRLSGLKAGTVYGKIRYYTSREDALADKTFFVSNCSAMGVTDGKSFPTASFDMDHLPVGAGHVMYISFYSDPQCQHLEGKALRGGIKVVDNSPNDTNKPVFYLQFVPLHGIAAYPVPSSTGGLTHNCQTSDQCISPKQPTAFCNQATQSCRYDNLYPLNNRGYQAFGQGISLKSGKIIGIPGFAKETLTDPLFTFDFPKTQGEGSFNLPGFDGVNDLFVEQGIVSSLHAHAFAGVARLPSGSTVIAGGAIKVPIVDQILPTYYQKILPGKNLNYAQEVDATVDIVAVNSNGAVQSKGGLSNKLLAPSAFVVGKSISHYKLFIANGLKYDGNQGQWVASKDLYVCNVGSNDDVKCPTSDMKQTALPRVGAAYTCIQKASDGMCEKELILGGTLQISEKDPFAEVCTIDGCKGADLIQALSNNKQVKNKRLLIYAKAFTLGNHIYTVGGLTAYAKLQINKKNKTSWPALFEFTPTDDGNLKVKAYSFNDDKVTDALRGIYKVVTPVDKNTVVISGGITPDYEGQNPPISNKVVILKLKGDQVEAQVLDMRFKRFAHQAAVVSAGPLRGAVLIWGGLTEQNGELDYLRHAEIVLP